MEDTLQMTDESSGEVVEVPSPKEEDKHPLLQKDITIANLHSGPFTMQKRLPPSNTLIYISSTRSGFI
jgi:hypothetical protein